MVTYELLRSKACGSCDTCFLCTEEGQGKMWHVKRLGGAAREWEGLALCADCLREKGLLW